ncbi:MAG: hypothetical protein QNI84_14095 [Henriciella sp.]|nr:hypothetical protein [Henriciella sp.]
MPDGCHTRYTAVATVRWFWQKPAPAEAPDIRYAHPNHELFNKRLEEQRNPSPPSKDLTAPWMKADTLLRLPQVGDNFEQSADRDAMWRSQDRHKELAKSTSTDTGSISAVKDSDVPKPSLKPKGDLRKRADQAAREDKWFAALRDTVMDDAQRAAENIPKQMPSKKPEPSFDI